MALRPRQRRGLHAVRRTRRRPRGRHLVRDRVSLMRALLASSAVVLFACHETTSLPQPELSSATRSIILIGAGEDQPALVYAIDVRAGETPNFPELSGKGQIE